MDSATVLNSSAPAPLQVCQKGEERKLAPLGITVQKVLKEPLAILKMKRNFARRIKVRMIWFCYGSYLKRAMKNGNLFRELSILQEKSRKVKIWKCSESDQLFLFLQTLCNSPGRLDKLELKSPFGLCHWFVSILILFTTNHSWGAPGLVPLKIQQCKV